MPPGGLWPGCGHGPSISVTPSLLGLLGAATLDEDSWVDIPGAAAELTERLRSEVAAHGVADAAGARALLRRVLVDAVGTTADRSIKALPHDGRPFVLLIVGVNGTGKTTTTPACWSPTAAMSCSAPPTPSAPRPPISCRPGRNRVGAVVVRADSGTDPRLGLVRAVKRGIADGADAVLIETAGRLHTKTGMLDELGKVKRVIEKQAKADEVLLVLDHRGIVLTKLDGTVKGGIVVAVQARVERPGPRLVQRSGQPGQGPRPTRRAGPPEHSWAGPGRCSRITRVLQRGPRHEDVLGDGGGSMIFDLESGRSLASASLLGASVSAADFCWRRSSGRRTMVKRGRVDLVVQPSCAVTRCR